MRPSPQTITYGTNDITYVVEYRDRKTLDISVHPNTQVVVTAPLDTDLAAIKQRVHRRARWILKQQQYFSQFAPRTPERQYISGETHLYLGRQYRLKVSPAEAPAVKLISGRIQIHTPTPDDPGTTRKLLNQWYRDRADFKFPQRLELCMDPFRRRGYEQPPLRIRRLAKRWGSLTASKTLILNLDLIRASSSAIDYVITHELCHLAHPNHGPHFYDILTRILPDWETRKLKLEHKLV